MKILVLLFLCVAACDDSPKKSQSGCCSKHKGVCGCSPEGETQCCDGTKSPSCKC